MKMKKNNKINRIFNNNKNIKVNKQKFKKKNIQFKKSIKMNKVIKEKRKLDIKIKEPKNELINIYINDFLYLHIMIDQNIVIITNVQQNKNKGYAINNLLCYNPKI